MAIILSLKKLQSLFQKEHESLLVLSHSNSGVIRVVGMIEYLEEKGEKEDWIWDGVKSEMPVWYHFFNAAMRA
jgi:hypothetical protein